MVKLVVLVGAQYWACVRVEKGGLECITVTASMLMWQESKGLAAMGASGTVSPPCVPCAGHAGARPRTSHRRHPYMCRWRRNHASRGKTFGPWPGATCGRRSMRLPCVRRRKGMRRPYPGRRRRSCPATGRGMVLGHRGAGAALLCAAHIPSWRNNPAHGPPCRIFKPRTSVP